MIASFDSKGGTIKADKKVYHCPKCKSELDDRIHRSFAVKTFLFWLPLRRYACYNCKRKVYVWR